MINNIATVELSQTVKGYLVRSEFRSQASEITRGTEAEAREIADDMFVKLVERNPDAQVLYYEFGQLISEIPEQNDTAETKAPELDAAQEEARAQEAALAQEAVNKEASDKEASDKEAAKKASEAKRIEIEAKKEAMIAERKDRQAGKEIAEHDHDGPGNNLSEIGDVHPVTLATPTWEDGKIVLALDNASEETYTLHRSIDGKHGGRKIYPGSQEFRYKADEKDIIVLTIEESDKILYSNER